MRNVEMRNLESGIWNLESGIKRGDVPAEIAVAQTPGRGNYIIYSDYEICNTMWRFFQKKRGTGGKKCRNLNGNSDLRVPRRLGTGWDKKTMGQWDSRKLIVKSGSE